VKTLAFVMSLVIIAVGAVGILAPPALVWIAQHSLAPVELYAIAAVRVAFGLLLISVASASRVPKTLRVVAFIPLVAGIATPFVGIERAQTVIEPQRCANWPPSAGGGGRFYEGKNASSGYFLGLDKILPLG
jgi:ABC-type multidrug transport system permease subunit